MVDQFWNSSKYQFWNLSTIYKSHNFSPSWHWSMIIRNLRAFMIISLTIEIYNKHKSLPVWLWDKSYFHSTILWQCYQIGFCANLVAMHLHRFALQANCIVFNCIKSQLHFHCLELYTFQMLHCFLQCCSVFASFYELYFFSTSSINCDFALKLFEEAKFTFQIATPSLLLTLAFNINLVFCDPFRAPWYNRHVP